ncbi:MAG: hypothetical protein F6K24_10605 [Okeania sp. SIO2D1]|nr:hypothetical protein [Okeania sp. SIO2D1]
MPTQQNPNHQNTQQNPNHQNTQQNPNHQNTQQNPNHQNTQQNPNHQNTQQNPNNQNTQQNQNNQNTQQNQNNQNTQQNQNNKDNPGHQPHRNLFQRFIQPILNNSKVIFAGTIAGAIGGFIVSTMGFVVDFVEFQQLLKRDTSNYKSGWVLVKITGSSVTSYDSAEQQGTDGLKAFFVQKLKGTSKLTRMIYTDDQPTDELLNQGVSPEYDISVLKNVDYVGEIDGFANTIPISKRNSETLNARLIQASRNEEPVCLFVYGIRDNEKSQFLNILDLKTVDKQYQDQYNNLKKEENSQEENSQKKLVELVELTEGACPNNIKPDILLKQLPKYQSLVDRYFDSRI